MDDKCDLFINLIKFGKYEISRKERQIGPDSLLYKHLMPDSQKLRESNDEEIILPTLISLEQKKYIVFCDRSSAESPSVQFYHFATQTEEVKVLNAYSFVYNKDSNFIFKASKSGEESFKCIKNVLSFRKDE